MKQSKRWLVTSILVSSLSVGTISYFAAAPKAGSKCVKVGATQTLNGKKFTCIKSGNKLVWNKGVALPKAQSTPQPLKSNSAIAPEIVSSQWAEVDKGCISEGETAFTLKGPVICFKQLWTLVTRVQDSVESRAYRFVIEHWNKQPEGSLSVTFYIDPKSGPWVNEIEAGLRAGARFWQTSEPGSRSIPAFISEDYQYIEDSLAKAGIPQREEDKARNRNAQGGQAGWHGNSEDPNAFWDFLFKLPRDRSNVGYFQVGPHEYTHFAQSKLAKDKLWDDEHMPWIHEGLASYFGSALGPMSKMPHNQMDNWRGDLKFGGTKLSYFADNSPVVYSSRNWGEVYPMGAIASQALVALFGVEGIIAYYKDLSTGMGNQKSYIKNFKLNDVALTQFMESYVEDFRKGNRWSLSTLETKYKEAVATNS